MLAFLVDTVQGRSCKHCVIMTLLGVYTFIVGLMTLTLFQGHRGVRNINCMFWIPVLCTLNVVWLPHTLKILCTI